MSPVTSSCCLGRQEKKWTFTAALCCYVLLLPVLSHGQDDFFSNIDVDIGDGNRSSDRAYSVIGWATQKLGYGLRSPGPLFNRQQNEINKIETSLYAQLDVDLGEDRGFRFSSKAYHDEVYRFFEDSGYSPEEVNEFRTRYEVRDLYYEQRLESDSGVDSYFKIGHQIVAWGMSDYLRVTDLINIQDQTTFGQQDLEDLRLQVPAILASVNVGDWLVDGVVTWEAGFDYISPAGDEFDQFAALRAAGFRIDMVEPDKQHEVFVRLSRSSSGGDIQIVAGEYNDNGFSVQHINGPKSISPQMIYSQNRMRAIGVAANKVRGSWLFFGEAGLHKDKAVQPTAEALLRKQAGWDEKDQLLLVLGAEYNGFRNLVATWEINSIHTDDHDEFVDASVDQLSLGFRLYWTALNDRLQVLGVMNELADSAGRFGRLSVDYDWSDNLSLGAMWVNYNIRDSSVFFDYRNNDILQLQLRYNFQY